MSAVIDCRARAHFAQRLDARGVPEHLHEGLLLYLCGGVIPGHFLRAVLNNDLVEAFVRGDEESLAGLPGLCNFLYYDAPATAWGNHGRVLAWQDTFRNRTGTYGR